MNFEEFLSEAKKPEFSTLPEHATHSSVAKNIVDQHKHDGWDQHHELYHGGGSKIHHFTSIPASSIDSIHHNLIKKGFSHHDSDGEHTYKHSSGVHVSIDKHLRKNGHEVNVTNPLTKTGRASPVKKKFPEQD